MSFSDCGTEHASKSKRFVVTSLTHAA